MKIINIIKSGKIILDKTGNKNSQLDIELLIAYILGERREYIHIYPNNKLDKNQVKKIFKLIEKRANGFPLAYIFGRKDYYNLEFRVTKQTLIPRPETELLVDEALALGNRLKNEDVNFIDVGTGSGCIIISLKNYFKNNKNFHYFGLDKYKKTLKIAKDNLQKNNLKNIKFKKSDLLKYFLKNKIELQKYNVLMANLPYLTKKQYKESLSIKKEPKRALVGGDMGINHYERLLNQIRELKK
ncbi:peptide chain release factor N(5)-glutamine methyltransferase, partial [bacterium]|nr:peptide chain release factor N(5)-glutamine methyltransferase [bacterium]